MKRVFRNAAFALAAVAMAVTSCETDDVTKSDEKQIISFVFNSLQPPVAGVINQTAKTITATVPYGTNVTALAPVIEASPKATVAPATGVPQNFTTPLPYVVVAENGEVATYIVTIAMELPQPIELTSPITANITLKDLGLPIDYFFAGSTLFVQNNAVLTIEPGVTIQFTSTGDKGSLQINDGATIKAIGTAEKHIQ
ncbi:MAG: DUF5018 domain-containing protein, partial [Bacteroidales bacterium]|nr:DUF5018 domain-containing protein [Bacteroidales bacterium]